MVKLSILNGYIITWIWYAWSYASFLNRGESMSVVLAVQIRHYGIQPLLYNVHDVTNRMYSWCMVARNSV